MKWNRWFLAWFFGAMVLCYYCAARELLRESIVGTSETVVTIIYLVGK